VSKDLKSRRNFLKATVAAAGTGFLSPRTSIGQTALATPFPGQRSETGPADYILRIASSPVEIAPKHIVSTIAYNGQFPGPLLRFNEGQPVTVEVHNDTDTPEQLHWHGQIVPDDVDGAAEEGTLFIPVRRMRRIVFTPRPSVKVAT
jgi:FtsP/CotA-like multicopper oxidase with cupredoxin domain